MSSVKTPRLDYTSSFPEEEFDKRLMMSDPRMTVAECIEWVEARLGQAGLFFGHGTDNARDEAAWLVLHVVGARLNGSFTDWGRQVGPAEESKIRRLVRTRIQTRQPLAYLIGTARFAGLEFEVSPSVLVPRSPIAELIRDRFRPWVDPENVSSMLDMCTGSGCIAIASAVLIPHLRVDAVDISPEALAVAARNVNRHAVADRVSTIESDLFQSLASCRYDLIVANPPYVPESSLRGLPDEYLAEPRLGLVSGSDGLEAVISILVDAPGFLSEDGVLFCEVGESECRLAALLPRMPFLWLEFERGGSGVFALTRKQLQGGRAELTAVIGERNNVA